MRKLFFLLMPILLASCGAPRETRVALPPASSSPGLTEPAAAPNKAESPDLSQNKPSNLSKPATVVSEEESSAKARRLILEVEKLSSSAQKKWKEDRWASAKTEFETALDLILSSGMDLRKYPRLKQNFDEIFNYLYQIEGLSASLETDSTGLPKTEADLSGKGQGREGAEQEANLDNGEQDLEPAAIDELGGVNVFPITIEEDLRERVTEDIEHTRYDIPVIVNEAVLHWLEYYKTKGRRIMELGIKRIGLYRDLIYNIFSEAGMPKDLIYLAQQESMFKPLAQSRSRARGMWQFMLGTGKLYGLKQDTYIDEKLDPEKSTRAAAQHLQKLYRLFGDWYLAMAAYNAGEGRIQRIMEKTGLTDFWDLADRKLLREQTASYVPSILAFMIIGKHPEKYGFNVEPLPPVQVKKITTPSPIELSAAAAALNISAQHLHELNPELRRRVTPAQQKNYALNIPIDASSESEQKLASLPITKRLYPAGGSAQASQHKVQSGDSLWSIARHYGITVEKLKEANLLASHRLHIGQTLAIPGHGEKSPTKKASPAAALAKNSPSSASGKSEKAPDKDTEKEKTAKTAAPNGNGDKTILHRVKRGDSLYTIARRYRTSVAAVRQWNRLFSDSLHPGDTLLIFPP